MESSEDVCQCVLRYSHIFQDSDEVYKSLLDSERAIRFNLTFLYSAVYLEIFLQFLLPQWSFYH